MPRAALALSLLGLFTLLSASAASAQGAPRRAQPECVFGEGDVLPLQGAGMAVPATLNREALRLEISTGLGLSSLLPETAQRLRLAEDPRVESSYPGPTGRITRRNVRSASLRVGEQEWTGRSLAVRPFYGVGGGPPGFDGVLGADLLREGELEIDLPARRVAIHRAPNCRSGHPRWAPAASAPLQPHPMGVPVIMVRVNGQAVRARIASGNNISSLSETLANRLALNTPTGRRGSSTGSDPNIRRGREVRLEELATGEEILRGGTVFVAPDTGGAEDEELTLGQDWLRPRKVWISFSGRRLFLARPGE